VQKYKAEMYDTITTFEVEVTGKYIISQKDASMQQYGYVD